MGWNLILNIPQKCFYLLSAATSRTNSDKKEILVAMVSSYRAFWLLASVFKSEEQHKYHWEEPYVGKMSVHSGQTSACVKSQHCRFNMENMNLTVQLQSKQKCTDA